jgi:hypothetical protein|uniref:Uncharacterized protein n=1 Tax=Zea mays TaxID=4577 RepID=A0A804UGI8_MAIZE
MPRPQRSIPRLPAVKPPPRLTPRNPLAPGSRCPHARRTPLAVPVPIVARGPFQQPASPSATTSDHRLSSDLRPVQQRASGARGPGRPPPPRSQRGAGARVERFGGYVGEADAEPPGSLQWQEETGETLSPRPRTTASSIAQSLPRTTPRGPKASHVGPAEEPRAALQARDAGCRKARRQPGSERVNTALVFSGIRKNRLI